MPYATAPSCDAPHDSLGRVAVQRQGERTALSRNATRPADPEPENPGPSNTPPNGSITLPSSDVTIVSGGSVTFAGSGADADGNVPLTYRWDFGSGGPSSSTSQNPGAVAFPTAGVYAVTLTVTDSLGASDPTPATVTVTVTVQPSSTNATLLPTTGWAVRFVDGEELQAGNYAAANAFDGNPNTAWMTPWFGGGPAPPHEIQIDLGAVHEIAGFRYQPYAPWQAGRIGDYAFYVSTDGTNWGAPLATGSFPDTNSPAARDVMFPARSGRYVRLRALTEVNNRDWTFTAVSELGIWKAAAGSNAAPAASVTAPAADLTVPVGGALNLTGGADDPDGDLPLTYRWSFTPGSGIADITTLDAGLVHFDRPGTFQATFTVTDSTGRSAMASRMVSVRAGDPLPRNSWTLRFVDSQETVGGANAAANAFDGNVNTMWATQWFSAAPPHPHEIQIDLGAQQQIAGFRYVPRQDGQTVGNIAQYEFYVSSDGVNWGAPAASGVFGPDPAAKEVAFPFRTGRYVRLRALSEVSGMTLTTVAELEILQPACLAPSVRLLAPRSRYIQHSPDLQISAFACPSAAGQGVRFLVDGASIGTDFAAPYAITATGLSAAEHVVEAVLVDSNGAPVVGPTAYDRAEPVAIGDLYVAMGDGITIGYGDDIASDDNSADMRTVHGGYTSILGDALTAARGYPVAVMNEGVVSSASADGAAYISTLLQKYPNANYFLLLYGHNDADVLLPSGLGLSPGAAGYNGSFKDYMQRMITAIRAAGKTPVLARPPAVVPVGGAADNAIVQYGMVIAELAANPGNGVQVPPPDFHAYFSTRTDTHYSTLIEMNGLGYQAMAQLWLAAILAGP